MSDQKEYRNPTPTVDMLIEIEGRPGELVFIERGNEPKGFALPGGFVDEGEWIADAAVREAKEETRLDVVRAGHTEPEARDIDRAREDRAAFEIPRNDEERWLVLARDLRTDATNA